MNSIMGKCSVVLLFVWILSGCTMIIDQALENAVNDVKDTEQVRRFRFKAEDAFLLPGDSLIVTVQRYNGTIRLINYKSETVVSEIVYDIEIGYCDAGNTGKGYEFYVPGEDGIIDIFNAVTFEKKDSYRLNGRPWSIAADPRGLLITSTEKGVQVHGRDSLKQIGTSSFYSYGMRLWRLGGSGALAGITLHILPPDLSRVTLDSLFKIRGITFDDYHGDYPLSFGLLRASPNGEYFITSEQGAVYTADGLEYRGLLSGISGAFSDYAFSKAGDTIYAAPRKGGAIYLYLWPSLKCVDSISHEGSADILLKNEDTFIGLNIDDWNDSLYVAPVSTQSAGI